MKVLFLTDEFYPHFGANSLIVKTVALEMIKRSIQVFVMPAAYDCSLPEKEKYNGIQIIRGMPTNNMENVVSSLKSGKFIRSANVVIRHFVIKSSRNGHLWHKDRVFAREYLRNYIIENSIDAVISINCSIELSFPIYWLKKNNKVKCKWYFYMLDPFESHIYYRQYYKISELRMWQHRIMNACNGVFATGIICDEVRKWEDPPIVNKLRTLEFPKIEEAKIIPCNDEINLPSDRINIVCTGSRNEEVRNSVFTISVCKSIQEKEIMFHFVGLGWTDTDKKTDGNCVFYTPRSWQAIRNMQLKADYLLNIGNLITNQLPSKVLEYISTGSPIINIFKSNDCPTLKLLDGYDALNLYEGDKQKASVMLNDYIHAKHERMAFSDIKTKYKEYTPDFVTDTIIETID